MSPPAAPSSSTPENGSSAWVPWSWLDAVGAFAFAQLATVALTLAVLAAAPNASDDALLVVSQFALGGTVVLWVAVRYRPDVPRLLGARGLPARGALTGAGLGLLTYGVVNFGVGALLELAVRAGGAEVPVVQESFREAATDPLRAPLFVVSAVLVAPIAEELFFRGLLFQALRTRLGVPAGIALSALVFGAVHLSGDTVLANVLVFVITALLGAVFAWGFHRRGSLLVPIGAHMMVNLISTILLIAGLGDL